MFALNDRHYNDNHGNIFVMKIKNIVIEKENNTNNKMDDKKILENILFFQKKIITIILI